MKSDTRFQRHTYRSVENMLFNHGHEDAANKIHKAMHDESRADEYKHPENLTILRRIYLKFHWFWGWLTNYGTNGWILVGVVCGWMIISASLFSINVNIGPSEQGLAATFEKMPERPKINEWGVSDGIWMSIRYHIPVINLAVRDEWEPSDDKAGMLACGRNKCKQLPFTSETYAFSVQFIHWIIIPIIIFIISRKLLRNRDE